MEHNDYDKLEYKDFFPDLTKEFPRGENKFNKNELQKGTEEEHEHTDDDRLAVKIAKDHLGEDPEYYTHLEKCKQSEKPEGLMSLVTMNVSNQVNEPVYEKSASGPHITGDIDGTPVNKKISSSVVSEGGSTIKNPKTNEVYFKFNDSKPIKIANLDENESFVLTINKGNNIEFYDYNDKNKMKIYVK